MENDREKSSNSDYEEKDGEGDFNEEMSYIFLKEPKEEEGGTNSRD